VLKVEQLYKSYPNRPVLQGINLEIKSGEIYGLLGPNGAGKTTLINIICHLLNADQGQVYIAGESWRPSHRYLLGVAPQKDLLPINRMLMLKPSGLPIGKLHPPNRVKLFGIPARFG